MKSDGTSPGVSRAHCLTTSRRRINHTLKLLAQACKELVWPRCVGSGEGALSMLDSANHAQKLNQNTPNSTTGCCLSWALEAQFWLCLQGYPPSTPLHCQGRTLQFTAQLQRSLRCVICSVLVIARHCPGPVCALVSVTLFPSVPSGICK